MQKHRHGAIVQKPPTQPPIEKHTHRILLLFQTYMLSALSILCIVAITSNTSLLQTSKNTTIEIIKLQFEGVRITSPVVSSEQVKQGRRFVPIGRL